MFEQTLFEVVPNAGERVHVACERLAESAPSFMVFNDTRVEAMPGDTAQAIYTRWLKASIKGTSLEPETPSIPHGEGWPYPKRAKRDGTKYHVYNDRTAGKCGYTVIIAMDANGDRRCLEISDEILMPVLEKRGVDQPDRGLQLMNAADYETLLQSPDAWTAHARPPEPVLDEAFEKRLAKALFLTDPDLVRHLDSVADDVLRTDGDISFARGAKAAATAWRINDLGLRAKNRSRAGRLVTWLREIAKGALPIAGEK